MSSRVVTIVELPQKVCRAFVHGILEVLHNVRSLFPNLGGLHQIHLALDSKGKQ